MYQPRRLPNGEVAVEFVDGTERYLVHIFHHVTNSQVPALNPEWRARDYADFCNKQAAINDVIGVPM